MKNDANVGIAAIITDLGGVIIAVDKRLLCAELAKHSTLSAEELLSNFSSIRLTKFDLSFGKGLITPEEFYEASVAKLKLSGISFAEFARIYSAIFKRKEDSIVLLRKLAEKHKLALLSNTDALHHETWAKMLGKDMKLFKKFILSFQFGHAKPEPQIYLEAARRLGLKPQQCIFIDDVQEYADAATKVGMHGIHFVSAQQLESDLEKLGVKA